MCKQPHNQNTNFKSQFRGQCFVTQDTSPFLLRPFYSYQNTGTDYLGNSFSEEK